MGLTEGLGEMRMGTPKEKNTQITQIFLCITKRWMEIAGCEGTAL